MSICDAAMLKKQATKEKEELEMAIASGMVQQKGLGKKQRREKDQKRRSNLGLYEAICYPYFSNTACISSTPAHLFPAQ